MVVACSGGADSTALLRLLSLAAGPLDLRLTVAHLDHGLRPESGEDARFVASMAEELGLAFECDRADVAAAAENENLEAAGRRLRRRFLLRVAESSGSTLIALGHHRDDQAETVLFRILRGCGTTGLAAMSACDPPYVRPLLGFSRQQIQAFLRKGDFGWREDASNRDLDRTRNRLRHQVLPLLEELQADAAAKLSELASRTGRDEVFWQSRVRDWVERQVVSGPEGCDFPLQVLLEEPEPLRFRIWLHLLRAVGGREDYGEVHLQACERLLGAGRPQLGMDLPGLWAGRRYERVLLRKASPGKMADWQIEIPAPGDYLLPDGRLLQLVIAAAEGASGDCVEFAANQIEFPLRLRNRRPGDRFFPCGAPGSRKLKNFFIDAHFSLEQRSAQPLLVSDAVLWVVGVRRSHGRVAEPGRPVWRCRLSAGPQADKTA